ncbi:MAG: hypothetical protein LBN07_01880 [Christensenellaceae bacterium]|jgi:cell division protein FtsA|nr:hypothetical protein [Christensenellaceae bacterium]
MPKKEEVAVLDFGSERITVVIGTRDVNNTFRVMGSGEAEYAGFMDGEFLEIQELKLAMGMAISNAEGNSKTEIKELFIGVPTEFLFCVCKNVGQNYPKARTIKQRDIDELFFRASDFSKYNTHSVINQSAVYYVLDDGQAVTNPIGQVTSKLNACLSYILVEKGFIDLINGFVRDLGLSRVTYISSDLAQMQYLFDEDERERYVIMVDVGYITTSVCLIKGSGMLSMSSFSMGGGHITADLSECLKISFSEAEALKRKIVLSIEPKLKDVYEVMVDGNVVPINAKNANDIVRARIDIIGAGISKSLSVCKYEYPDYIPISLTGGGLNYLKGAKDYLGKVMGKAVEPVNISDPNIDKPHLSSVLGLLDAALRQKEQIKSGFGSRIIKAIKGIFG